MVRATRSTNGMGKALKEVSKQVKSINSKPTKKSSNIKQVEQTLNLSESASAAEQCWLMKAEPDPRMEKGIDISFSVDKFAEMPNQITQWDGVRNPEAKTMMKEKMKKGDRVLFYHSNCKLPGIAGLAKVVKEGYPDYTAWDSKHPYFDQKTDKQSPKWFMVDVQLTKKLPFLVPLALLQLISKDKSKSLDYLTESHRSAITSMQLLNRGRLSVQKVEPEAFEAIVLLGTKGGWQEWPGKWQSKQSVKEQKDEGKRKMNGEEGNEEPTESNEKSKKVKRK